MKGTLTLSLIISSLILSGVSHAIDAVSVPMKHAPDTAENTPDEFVAGEIVVVFEDNVTSEAIETLIEGAGGTVAEVSAQNPSRVVVAVPEGQEDEFINAYLQMDDVRTAEKNYIYTTQPEPGTTRYKTSVSD